MNSNIGLEQRYVLRVSLLTLDKKTNTFYRVKYSEDFTESELQQLLCLPDESTLVVTYLTRINSLLPQISQGNIKFPFPILEYINYLLQKYSKDNNLTAMYYDEIFLSQYTKQYAMGIPHDTLSIMFINNAPARIWKESLLYNIR